MVLSLPGALLSLGRGLWSSGGGCAVASPSASPSTTSGWPSVAGLLCGDGPSSAVFIAGSPAGLIEHNLEMAPSLQATAPSTLFRCLAAEGPVGSVELDLHVEVLDVVTSLEASLWRSLLALKFLEKMVFALLIKLEDGVVELPAVIVDYLGVKFGPVDTVLYAPNEASASYNPTYWVTGVATHVLGSSDFKQATDRQGNIFIACRNREDAKKMDKKMAFRLIKEIVRMNMEPTNICTILNEDQLFPLGPLKGPERHVLCVWIEKEARHGSSWLCKYIPPLSILKFTDLLNKLWGWDRLLAYDLGDEFQDPSDMPMYESYLEKFYASNHHHVKSAADAILQCIEKEKALSAKWKAKRIKVFPSVVDISDDIEEYMSNLVDDTENSRGPLIAYAAACITKEAELMIEWLSQDSAVPLEEYSICTDIRQWAFDLAMQGIWSTHTAAVLLGMAKEAGSLVENVRLGCLESTDISLRIRTYGSNFLFHKLDEFESDAELTPGVSDEMTSATERNQLTWGNTEGVSFRKKPKKNLENTIDREDEYPVIIFRRPTAVDEYKQSRSNAESMRP